MENNTKWHTQVHIHTHMCACPPTDWSTVANPSGMGTIFSGAPEH